MHVVRCALGKMRVGVLHTSELDFQKGPFYPLFAPIKMEPLSLLFGVPWDTDLETTQIQLSSKILG